LNTTADSLGTQGSSDIRLIDIPGIGWKLVLGWLLYGLNSWAAHAMWFMSTSRETPWLRLAAYEILRSLSWIALTWIIFAFLDRQPATSMPFRTTFFKVAFVLLALTHPWMPMTYFHDALMWIFIIAGIGHGVRFHYAQTVLAQARLQTLRSRMQPHFLFNALNGIAALVRTDSSAAERMITRLGDLLRAAMTGGDEDMIPVAEELNFAEQYLSIQQIRYADRLTIEVSFTPEARNLLVPRFILQPLVENAVKHGIEPLETSGNVSVHACVSGDRLVLVVRNDAPFIALPPGDREGLGLKHTRARLELLYPGDHAFSIHWSDHGIVETTIALKAQRAA